MENNKIYAKTVYHKAASQRNKLINIRQQKRQYYNGKIDLPIK